MVILLLEFQLNHCYLNCLILDHQVSQQSKANVTELQNRPLVIARHGLDKYILRCGIFSSNLIICFFMLHVFPILWGRSSSENKVSWLKTRNYVVLLIFYKPYKFWFCLFLQKSHSFFSVSPMVSCSSKMDFSFIILILSKYCFTRSKLTIFQNYSKFFIYKKFWQDLVLMFSVQGVFNWYYIRFCFSCMFYGIKMKW